MRVIEGRVCADSNNQFFKHELHHHHHHPQNSMVKPTILNFQQNNSL